MLRPIAQITCSHSVFGGMSPAQAKLMTVSSSTISSRPRLIRKPAGDRGSPEAGFA